MLQEDSLRRMTRIASRASLIIVLWMGSIFGFQILNKLEVLPSMFTKQVSADGQVNVWWPTEGSKVGDTQTFKAMVQDKNVSDYTMTWSVDDGQQNSMYDSSSDYPHKEAVVDLSTWNWKSSGPYKLTFTATGNDGTSYGQKSVTIFTPSAAQGPVTVIAGTSTPAENSTQTISAMVTNAAPSVSPTPDQPAKTQSVQAAKLEVQWPQEKATLNGEQTFKVSVSNIAHDQVNVYWKVGDGQLNHLNINASGALKEAKVDVSTWNWQKDNTYVITFIAKDNSGNEVGKTSTTIYTGSNAKVAQTASVTNALTTAKAAVNGVQEEVKEITEMLKVTNTANILDGAKLYVNPYSLAANAAKNASGQDAYQLNKIASNPTAMWLGNWSNISNDVGGAVSSAKSQGAVPVFVAYNIPSRDCGQYSAGGLNSPDGYRSWINSIANAIGGNKAVVILEPDALSLIDCLNSNQLSERYSMLADAVKTLKSKGNIAVYLDAGHPSWISATEMANRLNKAGVGQANGFALNTSNYYSTSDNINYGTEVSGKIGGKHFVIDTSRNGVGPSGSEWCNPRGRALGSRPTTSTGNNLVDAYLWVKAPGESDGNCNGGPGAGQWWNEYALELARKAAF